jgi:hypothetical protein
MTTVSSTPYREAQARRLVMEDRLARLERAVAAASGAPGWSDTVSERLGALSDALAAHVAAVEAPDGLLAEIVEAAPRLAGCVQRMRTDHGRLTEHLRDLIELAPSGDPDTIREHVIELMRQMVLHRHRGSDLVYEAFATDIGGQAGGG